MIDYETNYGFHIDYRHFKSFNDFIFACVSNDTNELKSFLKNLDQDIFQLTDTDLSDIHPYIAIQILRMFNFKKYAKENYINEFSYWKLEKLLVIQNSSLLILLD